jgi:protein MpaA
MRRAALAIGAAVAAALLAPAAAGQEPRVPERVELLGRSVQGRTIAAVRRGDPAAPRKVLVVGCVHGDECAGHAIVDALRGATPPAGVELLLVRDLNPDGFRRRTRQNARGVDLNRNASQGWRDLGPRGSRYYSGRRPFSEPETRAIRSFILRERPALTFWYHQPLALVDFPEAGGGALTRAYAAMVGLPARHLALVPGSLSRWQNTRIRPGGAFVIELPGRALRRASVARHVRAVLSLGAGGG